MKPSLMPRTIKDRKAYVVDRTPRALAAHGGKMNLHELSEVVTGNNKLMSRWLVADKEGFGKEAIDELRSQITFYKKSPRRWVAELINKDNPSISTRKYGTVVPISNEVDIDKPLKEFLLAVKRKAEQEIGQENLQLKLKIASLELDIQDLKKINENSIVNKYFKFSDTDNTLT